MNSTMTMSRLNQNGSAAVKQAIRHGQLAITDRGETVAFILSAARVEALLDSLEILGDGEAMKTIRAYQAGKLTLKDAGCLDD
jgi:PHD/YefM family antitoxin component YafN of YafNO toxin-antitoxin module